MITKVCKKCKIEKPICEFSKLKRSNKGYKSQCKVCVDGYNGREGYVYFVQQGKSGPIKIGFSKNGWRSRLSAIQVGNPYQLDMIKAVKGDRKLETKIHSKFNKFKMVGEWFEPHPTLLKYIKCLQPFSPIEFDKEIDNNLSKIDLFNEYTKFEKFRNCKTKIVKNKIVKEQLRMFG